MRDGFAELPTVDQQRMQRRSAVFDGVKKAAEFFGLRKQRFALHADISSAATLPHKVIYLLRHGEGEHNAWRESEFAAGRTPTAKRHNHGQWPASLHDPLLTAKGREDAAAATGAARALPRPSLLVTSPMRRAIQTMEIAFGDALTAGVPAIAHELCREAFHGTDPSVYDSRLSREALSAAFPHVDFAQHVLPTSYDESSGRVDDPLWWYCASPFGLCHESRGVDEAVIVEHAWRFLTWIMSRPEPVIGIATHSNFLLALYHGCLDGCPSAPQVFHTGELRAVAICTTPMSTNGPPGARLLPLCPSPLGFLLDGGMRPRGEELVEQKASDVQRLWMANGTAIDEEWIERAFASYSAPRSLRRLGEPQTGAPRCLSVRVQTSAHRVDWTNQAHSRIFLLGLKWSTRGASTDPTCQAMPHADCDVHGSMCSLPTHVLVKHMLLPTLLKHSPRSGPKLRRDVLSYRNECRFVKRCSRALLSAGIRVPTPYFVSSTFDERLPEQAEFIIGTEFFGAEMGYEQYAVIPEALLPRVVDWLARLHAYYWAHDDEAVPRSTALDVLATELWPDGGFYSMSKRHEFAQDPDELVELPRRFEGLCERFEAHVAEHGEAEEEGAVPFSAASRATAAAFFAQPSTRSVGERLARHAEAIGEALVAACARGRGFRTMIHGDAKAGNVFFLRRRPPSPTAQVSREHDGGATDDPPRKKARPQSRPETEKTVEDVTVAMIDFQWSGVGLGAQDLVYLLCTSLESADVSGLLATYHMALARAGIRVDVGVLEAHFKVCFLDYARFTFANATHSLTPADVERNMRKGQCIPHKRSFQRLRWLIATAASYLDEWEEQKLKLDMSI